jgi:hypothetical protein
MLGTVKMENHAKIPDITFYIRLAIPSRNGVAEGHGPQFENEVQGPAQFGAWHKIATMSTA